MQGSSDIPIILLASANAHQDKRRTKLLNQERKAISDIFKNSRSQTNFRIIEENPDKGMYLYEQLFKHAFNEEIAVVHIAGFQDRSGLHFRNDGGEEKVKAEAFVSLLGKLPGLQCVFMNGCGDPHLRDLMLQMDVPALLMTEVQPGGRRYSQEIAHAFYSGLSKGRSIQDSFRLVKDNYANRFDYKKVSYDFEQDQMLWQGKPFHNGTSKLDWGMYVLDHNENKLEWRLPKSETQARPMVQDQVEKTESRRETIKMIGSGFLIGALIFLSMFLLGVPEKVSKGMGLMNEDYSDYVFSDRKTFNILQLPFNQKGSCEAGDPNYVEAIERRLEMFADTDAYPGSDFQFQKIQEADCPPAFGAVKEMILRTSADLAMWGELEELGSDETSITFQYLYTTRSDTVTQGSMILNMANDLFEGENDFISSAIEDVVYWARGMGHFERREFEEAVKYFSLIQVKEDESYIKVDSRLAKCFIFLKDYEKAKDHYDHILRIDPQNYKAYNERGYIHAQPRIRQQEAAENDFNDAIRIKPDYAEAYYNRGLLYYNMKRFSEAISDMEIVLELSEKQYDLARAYGVLAAIYADQKERNLFYENLEIALKNGLKMDRYVYFYSAFRTYRNEPEFKSLIQKYK